MTTSCETCPSHMTADKMNEAFGTDYGPTVRYCAKLRQPLTARPMSSVEVEEVLAERAAECQYHGQELESDTSAHTSLVGGVAVAIAPRPIDGQKPANCRDCLYSLDPTSTELQFGWNATMCLARGMLIQPRRLAREPTSCVTGIQNTDPLVGSIVGDRAVKRPDVSEIKLLPVYLRTLAPGDVATAKPPRSRLAVADGVEVDEDQRLMGIDHWLEIQHPTLGDGKPSLYLPVFDPDSFPPEERAKIPTEDNESRPDLYDDYDDLAWQWAVNVLGVDRTPVLVGDAGTGKTNFFEHLAWRMNLPFDRITFRSSTEVSDIIGSVVVEEGQRGTGIVTAFKRGRLTKRWPQPGVLLLDEPNLPDDPAVIHAIRPLMDGNRRLLLDEDEGQSIDRHPYCFMGLAMNPSHGGRYAGTAEMSEADGNRVSTIIVDHPPRPVERNIITSYCLAAGWEITNRDVDLVLDVAKEIRQLSDPSNPDSMLSVAWGVRVSLAAARLLEFCTALEAFRMAAADRFDPDQRAAILAVVKNFDTTGVVS